MKIKVLMDIIKEIKYIRMVINSYKESLVKGKYLLFPCFRALCIDDNETLGFAEKYFGSKAFQPKFQPIVRILNKTSCFSNSKSGLEKYDAVYIANNKEKCREIKLLSFKDKKILVICTSEDEKNNQIGLYESLKDYYLLPEIDSNTQYPFGYEVCMVDLVKRPNEIYALGEILKIASKKSKNCVSYSTVKELLEFNYECAEMNDLLLSIKNHIVSLDVNERIPICIQHGDLSTENLIYGICNDKEGFWWIDWEHNRERIFVYDFFFYILNTTYCSNNYEMVNMYFDGQCDELLCVCFDSYGIEYDPKRKTDYFLLSAICFLKERVCDKGNLRTLKEYCNLINNCLMKQY